jgi:tetratricopeptide (TPR) repeat protein
MCVLNEEFAKMLMQSSQLEYAMAVLEKNLVLSIRATGLDSPMTLHQHLVLGSVKTELKMFDEAWKHLSAAAYLVCAISGRAHPEASNVLMNMADCATRAGEFTAALEYLREIRERFEFGGDVVKLAYINQSMAELYEANKSLAEAKSYQTMAYKLFRQLFGEQDARTVDSKEKYAHLLRSNHSEQMNLLQQRQNEEEVKKEKERLKWLEDEDDGAADVAATAKSGHSKKNKKSKKSAKK